MWGWIMRNLYFRRLSVDEEILNNPQPALGKPRLLMSSEMVKYFGQPGDPDNLTTITTPYKMRIAWDLAKTTDRVLVHKKVAKPLLAVMNDLLAHYGLMKLQALGIDLFGGIYNFRPQRGLEKKYAATVKAGNHALALTYLSRHSYATAIDIDPARNTLKETSKTARFARPEYKPMIDIFYKHGFISYGVERNSDWMHFEYGLPA